MSKKESKSNDVNTWIITFEGDAGTTDDYQVEFFDVSEITKGLCLVSKYIDLIGDLQEKYEHYIISADIKYIVSELEGDMSDRFFLVFFAEGKNSKNYGLLLAEHEDGEKYPLIAIWPFEFFENVRNDPNYLDSIINDLIEKPDIWKKVEMILPIDIEELEEQ